MNHSDSNPYQTTLELDRAQSDLSKSRPVGLSIYRSSIIGFCVSVSVTIIAAVLHVRGARSEMIDTILALPELLTFWLYGDDDRFREYMHTVVMPFGVALNGLLGAFVATALHLLCRLVCVCFSASRTTSGVR